MTTQIPSPSSKVLYFDLDCTLIDQTYNITTDKIFETIQSLQKDGWIIGLSSDTPLVSLRNWKKQFGMNGDIIAERGSIVEVDGKVFEDEADSAEYQHTLQKMKDAFSLAKYTVWEGNTVDFIREKKKIGKPGDTVILINQYRTQSLGFYVRNVDPNGNLQIDNKLTNTVIDSVRDIFPSFDDVNEDLNHEYGTLILSRKKVVKRLGTQVAMKQRGIAQIGMIGNAITDFVGSDIAIHYAVSNATLEFRDVADYTAKKPLTEGAIEILLKLKETQ